MGVRFLPGTPRMKKNIQNEYMEEIDPAVAQQLSTLEDKDESRIVELLKGELQSTAWARKTLTEIHKALVRYFKDALGHVEDTGYVHDKTQEILKKISQISNARIVEGEGNLDLILHGSPVFLAANHLGTYKLIPIHPQEELGIDLKIPILHPFPMFYAPLWPVSERLGDNLYEGAFGYPYPISEIQRKAGSVLIPPNVKGQGGGVSTVKQETESVVRDHRNAAIAIFPESGTSGKRNNGGPYDLENFKTGAFVIASELNIPVLPVAQYFNPDSGFELAIFEPIKPRGQFTDVDQGKKYYRTLADSTRVKMQGWLNSRS